VIAYLDSSAITKLYLDDETGTDELHEITAGPATLATSRLSYVEVRSSLAAARRADRMARSEHERAVGSFEEAWLAYAVIELTADVSERAGAIADTFGLRAGDSIQLASMLELDPWREVIVVAWDARLRAAASAAGLAVFPPGV
jgi:predicted nucleic acid-binding protein